MTESAGVAVLIPSVALSVFYTINPITGRTRFFNKDLLPESLVPWGWDDPSHVINKASLLYLLKQLLTFFILLKSCMINTA